MKVVNILKIADIYWSKVPDELKEAFELFGELYQDKENKEMIYNARDLKEDARGITLSDQGLDQLDHLISLLDENDCSYVRFIHF